MKKRNITVALDVGSNTIKAAVAEVFYDHSINILAITKVLASGLRKGNIIDIEATAQSIESALVNLEKLTGLEISSAVIGFSGHDITAVNNHAIVAVGSHNYEITVEDKERVLRAAANIALTSDKTVVHIIDRQYMIDGFEGIKDPVGMAGNRLEVEIAAIIAATASWQNILRSAGRINLQVNNIVYNPLLAAEAVLLPAELEMGVVLINLGAGITEISFFEKGTLLYTSVLPVGGDYITKDLAIVLRTPIEEAEIIKEKHGNASVDLADENDLITIKNITATDTKTVSSMVIAEIIAARVNEIMEMIYTELHRFDCLNKMPAGIVLTGGNANLRNIGLVMEEYFNIPVRLGFPDRLPGLHSDFRQLEYANVIGALQYGAKNMDISYQDKKGIIKIFDKISYLLKDFFS